MGDMILPEHWEEPLRAELSQPYIAELVSFLRSKRDAGLAIFPAEQNWFRALELTPLDQVRAVILGQDPYHGPGQAHGLSFSVAPGVKAPPSLKNIFKELQRDIGIPPPAHGFLEHWARQGVLLLNTVLTVEMGRPGSHQKRGWERFTDAIIRAVSAKRDPVVFFLWGGPAQEKGRLVDTSRHLLLAAPHPSPLSAYRGFFGCKHFSRANAFLQSRGRGTIDWALPECGTSA